jgi:hypothetical protein
MIENKKESLSAIESLLLKISSHRESESDGALPNRSYVESNS